MTKEKRVSIPHSNLLIDSNSDILADHGSMWDELDRIDLQENFSLSDYDDKEFIQSLRLA